MKLRKCMKPLYFNRLHSCSVAGGFVSNFRPTSQAVFAACCGMGIRLLPDYVK
jgi:hypothetical protein